MRWMLEREDVGESVCRGGILGDDMGLGKTFQTIGLLKNGISLRTLILCPPALIAGWTEELKACGYAVAVLLTASWSLPLTTANTVFLTSYSKAVLYKRFLTESAFQRVILDEGHVIRNGKNTARWVACMAIAKNAVCRWILSATPVQNGYSDWRNLCSWLLADTTLRDSFPLAQNIMLRRTMAQLRSQIEALPPFPRFIEHKLSIPAQTPEGRLFRVLCDQVEHALESRGISALIKLELWMRIQQFIVHPQIYIQAMRDKLRGAYTRPDWTHGTTKWTACFTQLNAAIREMVPTIVFCNFRREMEIVQEAAEAAGALVFVIRGGLGSEVVGELVDAARNAAAAQMKAVVVVVQIVSGGTGLNLQFCRRIMFLSQHWNPAVVHQAVGRAVRIGQRFVVDIHVFCIVDDVMDNIDRRMRQIHLSKIHAARNVCFTLYEGFSSSSSSDPVSDPVSAEDEADEGKGVEVEEGVVEDEADEDDPC